MAVRVCLVLLLYILCWTQGAWAGTLSLSRETIGSGEVALLSYQGEKPSIAMVRFNQELLHMTVDEGGAVALIGVDVEGHAGTYPLHAVISDQEGNSEYFELELRVTEVKRPVERLSLPKEMVSPSAPEVLERIARERTLLDDIFSGQGIDFVPQSFILPVSDPVGSPFGLRRVLNGIPKSPHSGVDFRSPRGTAVKVPATARVVYTGDLYYTGRTVILDHGGGLYSYYAHLDEILCRESDRLARGELLGRVGSSGRSTGPHLHWGVKLRGDRIDPLNLLKAMGRERP